jgi:WD40-like Beta Propeller Repeat
MVSSSSFIDSTIDHVYPSFSPDGKLLFFSSNRRLLKGNRNVHGNRLWKVEKTESGWQPPVLLDSLSSQVGGDFANSVSKQGDFYFSSGSFASSDWNISESKNRKGANATPSLMAYGINTTRYEDGAFVSSDGSYLIFESDRPESVEGSIDLYISFKNKKDQWCLPLNMGSKINTSFSERFAKVSPDGQFLFFGSTRNKSETSRGFDVFWIDAHIIVELRNNESAQLPIFQPLGEDLIQTLYKKDAERFRYIIGTMASGLSSKFRRHSTL